MTGFALCSWAPTGQWGMGYGSGVGGGWGWHMMPFGYGGWGMLIWPVVIVALVIWVVRRVTGPGSAAPHGPSGPAGETPLDILKRRYASGEITREQFLEMKKDL